MVVAVLGEFGKGLGGGGVPIREGVYRSDLIRDRFCPFAVRPFSAE